MNRGLLILPVVAGVLLLLASACGGGEPPPTDTVAPPSPTTPPVVTVSPTADDGDLVAQGQAIFTGKGGCLACHTIEGITTGLVGPELTHIGTNAAERRPGMSARDYISESIREPEAFVAEGVERAIPGLMTTATTASLSDDEVAALVEFLLAQK